jgi:GNAT superfamily N-acetyltransferase
MQVPSTSLFRLNKSHAAPAIEVSAHAFQEYPLLTYYYPDPSQRRKINRYFCSLSFYYGIRFGEVYAPSPNLEGIAVWLLSKYYPMGIWNLLRAVPLPDLFGFAVSGAMKMNAMGRYVDEVHHRLAPFNHWYLLLLGVDPQFQGMGYASRLVRPMLSRADQEKLPCYLETNDPKDVTIYQHFGFKIIEEDTIPHTPVKNWAMLRKVNEG